MTKSHEQMISDHLETLLALGESRAHERILDEFVLLFRNELPPVYESEGGNGLCTALAQEKYQPKLALSEEDGDATDGSWNRKIALANIAVAEAIRERARLAEDYRNARRDQLASELWGVRVFDQLTDGSKAALELIIELEAKSG